MSVGASTVVESRGSDRANLDQMEREPRRCCRSETHGQIDLDGS